MAFKIKQNKKPVNSIDIKFPDDSSIEFFFRKPNQLELLEFDLSVDEFVLEFDNKIIKQSKIVEQYNSSKEEYDKLIESVEADKELSEEQKSKIDELQSKIDVLGREFKGATFQKPESRANVISFLISFIVSSKGIEDGTKEIDFTNLEPEDKDEIMNSIENAYLKLFINEIRKSVSLSPLG